MWREGALLLVFTEMVFAKEMVTVSDRIQFHSLGCKIFTRPCNLRFNQLM